MRMIYMIAADVLRALGWEVEIKEKDSYWSLVLTNTTSSEDMPQSHKSCLRGLLRGWLMEFNFEGGRQQVNIYNRYVLSEPVSEDITTRLSTEQEAPMKQLGKAINQFGVMTSKLVGCKVQTLPKPIGYLEHEESKTRIQVFKRIGWFHRCMLRWCFGVKYTKED